MERTKTWLKSMSEGCQKHGLTLISIALIAVFAIISITFAASAAGFPASDGSSGQEIRLEASKLDRDPSDLPKVTFPITLCIDSKSRVLHAVGGTVGELLGRWNISVKEPDYIKPSPETDLQTDMKIEIIRVTTGQVTEETPIAFEVERVPSLYIWKGSEVVKQEGKDGVLKTTYDVTYENGAEVSRRKAAESVAEKPVNKVVEYGTGGKITTSDGEVLNFVLKLNVKATAYTTEGYEVKTTATGTVARRGVIAVDPKVISYGTKVYVTSKNGTSWIYGIATAEDTGGAMKGNKVDLFFDTLAECYQFGRRNAVVYILESD
jgi:3D (Asp-Asp-Asp) domain-containing protein